MQKKRENPGHFLFSGDFLDIAPEVQSMKEKIDVMLY